MEALLQSVETDLRTLSSESRKSDTIAGQLAGWLANSEHPEVKVAAERAILKLRALSRQPITREVLKSSKELLRPFLLACETKNARLTVLALGSVQKLLANDVLSEEGTFAIITTLQHVERSGDEAVKLKIMQIVLALVQDTSCKSTAYLASVLGVCFRILSHSRNTDTVLNTAAATIRQLVAVVFENVSIGEQEKTENKNTNEAALLLIEDLCHLAGASPALWIQSPAVSQSFALELIESIITQNTELFHTSQEFEAALRERVCHVLQQLLSDAFELDAEPTRTGTHKITFRVLGCLLSRFYKLIPGKIAQIWHPLCAGASSHAQRWRQILCLQVLKTCVSEPPELYYLYEMYDLARDFDILAVSRVVDVTVELLNPRKRSVGGEDDRRLPILLEDKVSSYAVLADDGMDESVASTLAIETLLRITHAIHMLSKQCIDQSSSEDVDGDVFLKHVCSSMLDRFGPSFFSVFRSYLRSGMCSESMILMILKGFQDILQSSAVFELTSIMDQFLAALCQLSIPSMKEYAGQQESPFLSSLNIHAVRTLLNVVHPLGNVLGTSWNSVITTLYTLDGILMHSVINKERRKPDFGTETDLQILETTLKLLFDGTRSLCTEAAISLLSSLRDVSFQSLTGPPPKYTRPSFCIQQMVNVLLKNLDRVHDLWAIFLAHVIEIINSSEPKAGPIAIDALDRALTGIIDECVKNNETQEGADIEKMLLVALEALFADARQRTIRIGILRIALHVLQRSADGLTRGWNPLLRLLQAASELPDSEIISTAFDSVELLVNEYLDQLPPEVQSKCLRVVSMFSKQNAVMNVSLSAINLLWAAVDIFGKEVRSSPLQSRGSYPGNAIRQHRLSIEESPRSSTQTHLFYLINVLQELSLDKRPEVRNSGIRSFFAALVSYGSKFCLDEWNQCLADILLPLLKSVYYISMTSSSDESEGVEIGREKGRSVMLLMHYSRNSERKQWEETMVLALNGLCKILRLYLPLLLGLHAFSQAWEQITIICMNSMAQGTKDAALAAIALIVQVSETFGSSTTQLPTQAISSILRSMDESIQSVIQPSSLTPAIVRYEMVKAIGPIAKSTKRVLPDGFTLMFIQWLQKLACRPFNEEEAAQNIPDMLPITQKEMLSVIIGIPSNEKDRLWIKVVEALCAFLYPCGMEFEAPLHIPEALSEEYHANDDSVSLLWLTNVVELLEKIYLSTISNDLQKELFSQLLTSLTRCMAARFVHNSDGPPLWDKAAELFRPVLDLGLASMPEDARHGHQWMRDWETIANAFEAVFNGKNIKIPFQAVINPFNGTAASELKLLILDTLTDTIVKSSGKMSESTLRRLVALIDSTISSHGGNIEDGNADGNLCHSCLRKLFVLCSQTNDPSIPTIALPAFISRCKAILNVFSGDHQEASKSHLSLAKLGEVIFALEMLASLRVSPAVVETMLVHYPIYQRLAPPKSDSSFQRRPAASFLAPMRRPHLLMIYDTLCDCVMIKENNVRVLVADLLKSVGQDIGLL